MFKFAPAVRGVVAALAMGAAMLVAIPVAVGQTALPDVLAARVSTTPDRARLIVDLSGTTAFATVSLQNPERIAVDVKAANIGIDSIPPVAGQGLVTSYGTSMPEEGRVRTELILSGPAVVQQAYVLDPIGDQPARVVVDLVPTTEADFTARAEADLANSITRAAPDTVTPAEGASSEPSEGSSEAGASELPSSSLAAAEAQQPQSADVPTGEPTEAKRLVVIDPGHGGIDAGADGPSGIKEKDITLAFALQLRDTLVRSGHFDRGADPRRRHLSHP